MKKLEITYPISLEELINLRKKEKDPRVKYRLQMIILVKQGMSAAKAAKVLGTYHPHVSYRVKRFNSGGPGALRTKKREGLKPRVEPERIKEALDKSPREFGYPVDAWNVKILHAFIKKQFGVEYHPRYMYELIKRLGYSLIKEDGCQEPGRERGGGI